MAQLLSINAYLRPLDHPLEAFLRKAKAVGYEAVGLTTRDLEQYGLDQVAALIEQVGLEVSSLNSAGQFTFTDKKQWADQQVMNKSLVRAAVRLQAGHLVTITGGYRWGNETLQHAKSLVRDRFSELYEDAASQGVTLALEPIHPADIFHKGCLNSIAECLAFLEPFPKVKLALDTYHSMWDPAMWATDVSFWDKVGFVQASGTREMPVETKAVRDLLAEDGIGVAEWLQHLVTTPFAGAIEFELFHNHILGRDVDYLIETSYHQLADRTAPANGPGAA